MKRDGQIQPVAFLRRQAEEQVAVPPDTLHWFRAGAEGAVVSEFSTQSRDELDVFSDPQIVR